MTSASRARLLDGDVRQEFDELNGLVHALAVLREVSPRSRDAVHAAGEVVSSRIVAAAFSEHGIAEQLGRRARPCSSPTPNTTPRRPT